MQNKTVTLKGIITAADWSEDGRIIAVKIATIKEEEYLILNGESFIPLIQKNIQVTGRIDEASGHITVDSYRIFEDHFKSA